MGNEPGLLWRVLSVAGFLCLVGAYIANQRGLCLPSSRRYLLANVLGSGVLAIYSAVIGEWVFVALEGFWCVASLWAMGRPFGPRTAGLLVAILVASSAAGCGGDDAAPGMQANGMLLSDISRARLTAVPESNLPADVRELALPVVRLRRELHALEWREMPGLGEAARKVVQRPADMHVWRLAELRPAPLSTPVVMRGGVPVALGADPEVRAPSGEAFWWIEASSLLLVEARSRPAGLTIEYDAPRAEVFGAWESFDGPRTSAAAQLVRASVGSQTRDALSLPAPGALELDVLVPAEGALRFAVGVADVA